MFSKHASCYILQVLVRKSCSILLTKDLASTSKIDLLDPANRVLFCACKILQDSLARSCQNDRLARSYKYLLFAKT